MALTQIPESAFRLVRVLSVDPVVRCKVQPFRMPGSQSGTTQPTGSMVKLKSLALDATAQYCAISYVWGDQTEMCQILVNNKSFEVTPSLLVLLVHLYQPQKAGTDIEWFWIDQICIDQKNEQEKKVQVEAMHLIYSQATRTIVWLGPDADESQRALETLDKIHTALSPVGSAWTDRLADIFAHKLQHDDAPLWSAMVKLFARPWFTRLWIMQEAVLSKNISVHIGRCFISWDILLEFCKTFGTVWGKINEYYDSPSDEVRRAGVNASSCLNLDKLKTNPRGRDLLELLCSISDRSVRYPIDQLFGIRGMLSEDQRGLIRVDYKRPENEVWVECYKGLLTEHPTWFWGILGRAPNTKKAANIPSWCPNIDSKGDLEVLLTTDPKFTNPFFENPRPIAVRYLDHPRDSISVLARCIDSTSTVAPCLSEIGGSLEDILNWESQCHRMFVSSSTNKQRPATDIEIYIKTLLLQQFGDASGSANELIGDREKLYPKFEHYKRMLSGLDYEEAVFMSFTFNLLNNKHMRFFATANGNIGMGLRSMRAGDLVFSLYRCPCLWVMRKTASSEGYNLIGTAYMYGHMFHGLGDDDSAYRSIVIS